MHVASGTTYYPITSMSMRKLKPCLRSSTSAFRYIAKKSSPQAHKKTHKSQSLYYCFYWRKKLKKCHQKNRRDKPSIVFIQVHSLIQLNNILGNIKIHKYYAEQKQASCKSLQYVSFIYTFKAWKINICRYRQKFMCRQYKSIHKK